MLETVLRHLKSCTRRGLALLRQAGRMCAGLPTVCEESLIYHVPKVSEYLHDQGFECPKVSFLVAVCLFSAVIESHIQELKNSVS